LRAYGLGAEGRNSTAADSGGERLRRGSDSSDPLGPASLMVELPRPFDHVRCEMPGRLRALCGNQPGTKIEGPGTVKTPMSRTAARS